MKLSRRAKNIQPSLTLAITAKAKQMNKEGISIIGFGAGEPDFNTPKYIIDSAKKALDDGFTKYTDASGMLELRKIVCQKFKNDNGLEYAPEQIIVSNGAKHSLNNVMEVLIDEGDEVIIPVPYWLTYPELVTLAGGKTVYLNTFEKNDFKIKPLDLEKVITSKSRLLVLNTPSNPTGSVYTKDELEALAKVIEKYDDLFVVSDEIYEHLVYGGVKHYSIASVSEKMFNKTIVVNGVSKTYAMTGWRIGYLAAPLAIAKAIASVQSHAASNPNTMAQVATMAALSGGEQELENMRVVFDGRRKYMVERINAIKYVSCREPKGAFYVMMNVSKLYGKKYNGVEITDSLVLTEQLLNERVAVVPGAAFGADDFIRLSYAISNEDIAEGINRIETFVSKLV